MAAAVRAFDDVGVDRATVGGIVKDARSSVGSFYGRFTSKDDLVKAVDERLWAEVEERWRSQMLERAGVPAGGADPASDSATEFRIRVTTAGPSLLDLSQAVFQALTPDLIARSRAAAYLDRIEHTHAGIRVLARIEADVLRALRASPDGDPSAGLPEFLTGVVLKTATDPNVGVDAPLHLAHVLRAALVGSSGSSVAGPTPRPVVKPAASPEVSEVEEPLPPEPPTDTPTAPDDPPKPEAFDIWA